LQRSWRFSSGRGVRPSHEDPMLEPYVSDDDKWT
jgi:hypothetical protein